MLDAWGKSFESFAVNAIVGVVRSDFGPKSGRVVHVVEVGKFVQNDVVAQNFGDVHEADVEGDGAGGGARTPASIGVSEATFGVSVAVEFGKVF